MENNPLLQAESLALSQLNPLLAQIDLFALADVTNPYFGNQDLRSFGPKGIPRNDPAVGSAGKALG